MVIYTVVKTYKNNIHRNITGYCVTQCKVKTNGYVQYVVQILQPGSLEWQHKKVLYK